MGQSSADSRNSRQPLQFSLFSFGKGGGRGDSSILLYLRWFRDVDCNVASSETEQSLSDVLGQLIAFDADGRAVWPAGAFYRQLAREVLRQPETPVDVLRRTKEAAKRGYGDPQSPMAPEICLLVYYGCIAAALYHHNQLISQLGPEDLRMGLSWALRQPWLDEPTRELFEGALCHLRSGRHLWRR